MASCGEYLPAAEGEPMHRRKANDKEMVNGVLRRTPASHEIFECFVCLCLLMYCSRGE